MSGDDIHKHCKPSPPVNDYGTWDNETRIMVYRAKIEIEETVNSIYGKYIDDDDCSSLWMNCTDSNSQQNIQKTNKSEDATRSSHRQNVSTSESVNLTKSRNASGSSGQAPVEQNPSTNIPQRLSYNTVVKSNRNSKTDDQNSVVQKFFNHFTTASPQPHVSTISDASLHDFMAMEMQERMNRYYSNNHWKVTLTSSNPNRVKKYRSENELRDMVHHFTFVPKEGSSRANLYQRSGSGLYTGNTQEVQTQNNVGQMPFTDASHGHMEQIQYAESIPGISTQTHLGPNTCTNIPFNDVHVVVHSNSWSINIPGNYRFSYPQQNIMPSNFDDFSTSQQPLASSNLYSIQNAIFPQPFVGPIGNSVYHQPYVRAVMPNNNWNNYARQHGSFDTNIAVNTSYIPNQFDNAVHPVPREYHTNNSTKRNQSKKNTMQNRNNAENPIHTLREETRLPDPTKFDNFMQQRKLLRKISKRTIGPRLVQNFTTNITEQPTAVTRNVPANKNIQATNIHQTLPNTIVGPHELPRDNSNNFTNVTDQLHRLTIVETSNPTADELRPNNDECNTAPEENDSTNGNDGVCTKTNVEKNTLKGDSYENSSHVTTQNDGVSTDTNVEQNTLEGDSSQNSSHITTRNDKVCRIINVEQNTLTDDSDENSSHITARNDGIHTDTKVEQNTLGGDSSQNSSHITTRNDGVCTNANVEQTTLEDESSRNTSHITARNDGVCTKVQQNPLQGDSSQKSSYITTRNDGVSTNINVEQITLESESFRNSSHNTARKDGVSTNTNVEQNTLRDDSSQNSTYITTRNDGVCTNINVEETALEGKSFRNSSHNTARNDGVSTNTNVQQNTLEGDPSQNSSYITIRNDGVGTDTNIEQNIQEGDLFENPGHITTEQSIPMTVVNANIPHNLDDMNESKETEENEKELEPSETEWKDVKYKKSKIKFRPLTVFNSQDYAEEPGKSHNRNAYPKRSNNWSNDHNTKPKNKNNGQQIGNKKSGRKH